MLCDPKALLLVTVASFRGRNCLSIKCGAVSKESILCDNIVAWTSHVEGECVVLDGWEEIDVAHEIESLFDVSTLSRNR